MTDGRIGYEVQDFVATLTLDRPDKLNAATGAMSSRLLELIPQIDADPDVRVVVVTGTGRSFSVGSDISELDRYDTPWAFRNRRDYCDALRAMRTPAIAAVNGYAFGGGLEMALSCDIRLAATTAAFAAAEIKLGWIGGGGVTALLSASVAASDAATMLLTGAAAAGGIGFINAFGNIGGAVGPAVVGWLKDVTGSYEGGLYGLAAFTAISSIIAAAGLHIPRRIGRATVEARAT